MERTNEPSAHQHERDQQESKQPADVIRDGNLKASIWRNEGESGAFYATTFARMASTGTATASWQRTCSSSPSWPARPTHARMSCGAMMLRRRAARMETTLGALSFVSVGNQKSLKTNQRITRSRN